MRTPLVAQLDREKIFPQAGKIPCVSLIVPFEPKMSTRAQLQERLNCAMADAEAQLQNYPERATGQVMLNLKTELSALDYTTYRKSIAVFACPDTSKTYYLDIPVNEKVIVDDSFEIRDLVYNKKEQQKYLLLLLSGQIAKIYLGGSGKLMKIVSNVPAHIGAYTNDISERVGNFSDPSHRKEVLITKFLMHTDAGLGILLKAYPLPLFVMGNDKIIGHFRKISRNLKSIVEFVSADLINAPVEKISHVLQPHIADWNNVRQKHLMNKLDTAFNEGRMASGITDVWREAMQSKGRLLVVEKNYMVSAINRKGPIAKIDQPQLPRDQIIRDAVDEIIEKVLASGGDVEFVDDGMLTDHERIALILYY
jgi:hypothetical protein